MAKGGLHSHVSGLEQKRQRMAQPCVKTRNRTPGPSTAEKDSVEWMRPWTLGTAAKGVRGCWGASSWSVLSLSSMAACRNAREVPEMLLRRPGSTWWSTEHARWRAPAVNRPEPTSPGCTNCEAKAPSIFAS
jgi:hypothetical protein